MLLASHIIGCTNTSCSQCFVWSFSSELPWNFLIIHRGGLWHFPRHTLLYLFTHTPLLHYPPADERPETKNLSELVGFCHLSASDTMKSCSWLSLHVLPAWCCGQRGYLAERWQNLIWNPEDMKHRKCRCKSLATVIANRILSLGILVTTAQLFMESEFRFEVLFV